MLFFALVLKSSTSIQTWLKRRKGPSADFLSDLSQLERFIAEDDLVVLGLFKVRTSITAMFPKLSSRLSQGISCE